MKLKNKIAMMGRPVSYNAILVRHSKIEGPDKETCFWNREPKSGAGWVVGFRSLQEGLIKRWGEEGPTWTTTEAVPCVLVAKHPDQKHIPVPIDAIEMMPPGAVPSVETCSARTRAFLRDEMKNVKRDAKGRWTMETF